MEREKLPPEGDTCANCKDACTEKIEFLQGMPPEKQHQLMSTAVHEHFRKGSYLFHAGGRVDAIYIIRTGQVKLSDYDGDGGEKTAGIFTAHDVIWEGFLLDNSVFPYSAVCLSAVSVCKLHRRDFEAAISDPAVALRVIRMLSVKLHDSNERNLILSTSDPQARIAAFLLYRQQRTAAKYVTLRLDDIASSVNLRPETVSRKLRELEKDGLIRKTGQSNIELLDFIRLKEMAEG